MSNKDTSSQTSQFLQAVIEDGRHIEKVLLNPKKVAEDLGLVISAEVIHDISNLCKVSTETVSSELSDEIRNYISKTITNGQYISAMLSDPAMVSRVLGIELSAESVSELKEIKLDQVLMEPEKLISVMGIGTISIAVAVGIGAVLGMHVDRASEVEDLSGKEKL
ncbi:MAG: hypothetical protein GY694_16415 [Gammaproteobacteria bacterium]|nr:hypothetical protein [Gammaproteobacteria bacterium]